MEVGEKSEKQSFSGRKTIFYTQPMDYRLPSHVLFRSDELSSRQNIVRWSVDRKVKKSGAQEDSEDEWRSILVKR